EHCIKALGNPILPGYTASKIRWLHNHKRDAYDALDSILLPHDYLNYYLTGEKFTECGDASGTGLLDIKTRQWHRGMLQALDPDRDLTPCLPPLIAAGDIGGRLLPAVADQLGLPHGIPVACGGGDNMMAALGTGNISPGRLTISLGTSGTLFAYSDTPCIDPQGELAAFCSSSGGWLPLLCTMNCTVATELARDLFALEISSLETLLRDSGPGANGVTVLPFYNGERTPNLPNGKGCIMGLDPDNMSRANIMQASMEAAVFGLRGGLNAFSRVGCQIGDIRLTGGGSKNAAWRQMVADNFALPVRTMALDEGAALGAAMNALLTHQGVSQGSETVSLLDEHIRFDDESTAIPNPDNTALYNESYERYLQYLEQVKPLFK
ncbi:MAG: xylulokinase, partial [Halioglobus sp.]